MALTRQSRFGFPPQDAPPSSQTVRLVPLTTGVKADTAWPLQPPGSAQSMTNFLPLDGMLTPRSRLSSMNTQRLFNLVAGMTLLPRADGNDPYLWCSAGTRHARIESNGSISVASFVSSFGLGSYGGNNALGKPWQYASVYASNITENMLVGAFSASADTIVCLYDKDGSNSNPPVFSYLTSAPQAGALGVFDNYIIAFNIHVPNAQLASRVQWNVRGVPSNWTGEGSGFEDLLSMRGQGLAVRGTSDNRVILFSDLETWYGVTATYPAQFQFFPLDPTIGCPAPGTVQDTEFGLLFLGSDFQVRLLPRGGGLSSVVCPSLSPILRRLPETEVASVTFGVWDPVTHLYHLFVTLDNENNHRQFILNVQTGEWGYADYNANAPTAGIAAKTIKYRLFNGVTTGPNEQLFFGNSSGTIFSTNSLLNLENGSVVTSAWRSAAIGGDLPGTYKQLTNLNLDYRATSRSTVTVKISQDGNTYETTGQVMSLRSAPVSGRASVDLYNGGAFPSIELTSTSTGYELHRMDVMMSLGGRR